MVIRKPYHTRVQSVLRGVSWCAVLLTTVVVLTPHHFKKQGSHASLHNFASGNAPSVSKAQPSAPVADQDELLPNILSSKDIALYQTIFRAQKSADWAKADVAIDGLENTLLMGHVLAERYQNTHYHATAKELAEWLKHYNDHPQAADLYARAIAKAPSLKAELPLVRKQASLEGYGDDNGLAVRAEDSPHMHLWHSGLEAWKNGNKQDAAVYFASMADHKENMSPWLNSAASYWAYRAYSATNQQEEAYKYLHQAALHPRSFYGILARKQLKLPLDLDASPVALTDSDVLEMVGDQTIRRIVALTQAGSNELAEKELRARFPQADEDEKPRLLALAHELGLASVQISMAKQLRSDEHELDFARYPIPNWQPEGGFTVDPLLIFSLMRQESGFRPSAISPGGALGLMQLMPKTASFMQKKMGTGGVPDLTANAINVSEPIVNITLGQNYVEHLLTNELVDGNLFYLLAAYNAGPGRLQEWKASIGHNNDPLLFVESIPYGQTRNYVMQVMTNYWIYSDLLGSANHSIYAVLHNHWPSYKISGGPVADKGIASHLTPGGA